MALDKRQERLNMKWFKHYSTARNDERIALLEDKTGLEGYGFYFKMLEIVAEAIDESDKHHVTYSLSRWGRQANVTSKKFIFLIQCCSDVGLMIVQRDDNNITVKIPNLLKFRDNHTKNLQAKSKQEIDKEKDKDTKKDIVVVAQPKTKATRLPNDWVIPIEYLQFCEKERPDIDAMLTANTFKDYWISKSGSDATKTDWFATWRNWVRRQDNRPTNRAKKREDDLAWFLGETKMIEKDITNG